MMKRTLGAGMLAIAMTQFAQAQDTGPAIDCSYYPPVDSYAQNWMDSDDRQRLLNRGGDSAKRDKLYDKFMQEFWAKVDERLQNDEPKIVGEYFAMLQDAFTMADEKVGATLSNKHSIMPMIDIWNVSSNKLFESSEGLKSEQELEEDAKFGLTQTYHNEVLVTGQSLHDLGDLNAQNDVKDLIADGDTTGFRIFLRMQRSPHNFILFTVAEDLAQNQSVSMSDPVSVLLGTGGLDAYSRPAIVEVSTNNMLCAKMR